MFCFDTLFFKTYEKYILKAFHEQNIFQNFLMVYDKIK